MMTRRKGLIRSLFESASLVALLNAIVLLAILGWSISKGTIDAEKVRKIAAILRGDAPPACEPKAPNAELKPATMEKPQEKRFSPEELDIVQLEAERLRTELDQRAALVNSVMLKVRTEREALRQEREAYARQQEADRARQQDAGFLKQLDLLAGMNPRMALEHLLGIEDPETAARFLAAMDTDRARKIVEAAKRPEQLATMKKILQRMQTIVPAGGSELRAQADQS